MPLIQVLLFICFVVTLFALPQDNHQLHEKRFLPSRVWVRRDRVQGDALLPIKIGLKQSNLHKAYDYLLDVSHPESPNYSKHWSEDDVHEAFAPDAASVEAVKSWLSGAGVASDSIEHSVNRGWLHFEMKASEAEALLKTEYFEHEHASMADRWSVGCDEYHLPAHIREHVDYITPGVKHLGLRKRTTTGWSPWHKKPPLHQPFVPHRPIYGNLSDCDQLITPQCISALYDIPEPNRAKGRKNALGIFEDGDYYAQEDLNLFFANFSKWIPQGTHPTLKSVDGGQAPVPLDEAGGESDLDFQLAYPIVYPDEIVLYQVDDINYATYVIPTGGFGNTFLDALDGSYCNYTAYGETGDDPTLDPTYPDTAVGGYKGKLMCGTYKPASVISISYGLQEVDLPPAYQQRQCNEFAKLGLQGVSIFVASGDTGVAGVPDENSADNGCLGPEGTIFNPTNPNSCPYVTNVGATQVNPGASVYDPESAAWAYFRNGTFLFTSSGGFSNIYPVPSYQKQAVSKYFADHDPGYPYYEQLGGFKQNDAGKGIYNRIGHGIPDIAANGVYIAGSYQGKLRKFGGTSASSPMFASLVTRINDARLSMGKNPIGFINPALYSNPWVLNDIKNGSNPGCGTAGFHAVEGWDPVTGLGTPNLPRMLELFTRFR